MNISLLTTIAALFVCSNSQTQWRFASGQPLHVRLVDDATGSVTNNKVGLLQFYRLGQWTYVHNYGGPEPVAKVACVEMGYTQGSISLVDSQALPRIRPNDLKISMWEVRCEGYEAKLSECKSRGYTSVGVNENPKAVRLDCSESTSEDSKDCSWCAESGSTTVIIIVVSLVCVILCAFAGLCYYKNAKHNEMSKDIESCGGSIDVKIQKATNVSHQNETSKVTESDGSMKDVTIQKATNVSLQNEASKVTISEGEGVDVNVQKDGD